MKKLLNVWKMSNFLEEQNRYSFSLGKEYYMKSQEAKRGKRFVTLYTNCPVNLIRENFPLLEMLERTIMPEYAPELKKRALLVRVW